MGGVDESVSLAEFHHVMRVHALAAWDYLTTDARRRSHLILLLSNQLASELGASSMLETFIHDARAKWQCTSRSACLRIAFVDRRTRRHAQELAGSRSNTKVEPQADVPAAMRDISGVWVGASTLRDVHRHGRGKHPTERHGQALIVAPTSIVSLPVSDALRKIVGKALETINNFSSRLCR